jgi:hypothetical protein
LTLVSQLSNAITQAQSGLKEQQDWPHVYFSKSKSGRKSMFYEKKWTLFGKPLN